MFCGESGQSSCACAREHSCRSSTLWPSIRATFLFTLLAIPQVALAQGSPAHAKVQLIADHSNFPSAGPLWVGFLFNLDKGWHIYWQNAGDSGEPPRLEWKLPSGVQAGAIEWPTPVRLGSGTIIDYGYENQVLLMVPLRHGFGGTDAMIAADVKYIVCREICVPGKASLSLAFPLPKDEEAHLAEWQALFGRTRSQLPKPAPSAWKVSAVIGKDIFTLLVTGRKANHVMFFPLDENVIDNSAPQQVTPAENGFTISLHASDQLLRQISVLRGLLVFPDGPSFQIAAPVSSRLR